MLSFISIELIPNSHILSPKAGSRNEKDFLRRQVWKDKIFHSLSQNPMVTFFFFFFAYQFVSFKFKSIKWMKKTVWHSLKK